MNKEPSTCRKNSRASSACTTCIHVYDKPQHENHVLSLSCSVSVSLALISSSLLQTVSKLYGFQYIVVGAIQNARMPFAESIVSSQQISCDIGSQDRLQGLGRLISEYINQRDPSSAPIVKCARGALYCRGHSMYLHGCVCACTRDPKEFKKHYGVCIYIYIHVYIYTQTARS